MVIDQLARHKSKGRRERGRKEEREKKKKQLCINTSLLEKVAILRLKKVALHIITEAEFPAPTEI